MGIARLRIAIKSRVAPKVSRELELKLCLKILNIMFDLKTVATTNARQTARAVIDSDSEDIEIDIEKELNYDDSEYETTEIDNFIFNFDFLL